MGRNPIALIGWMDIVIIINLTMTRSVRLANVSITPCHRPPTARCVGQAVRTSAIWMSTRPRQWRVYAAATEAAEDSIEEEGTDNKDAVAQKKAQPAVAVARKKRSRRFKGLMESKPTGEMLPIEAINALKEMASAKFDETVELHGKTALDPRYADQQLRSTGSMSSRSFISPKG